MKASSSHALLALILAAGLSSAASPDAALAADKPADTAVRAAFAAPFNAAQDLMKAGKGPEALAKLKEAEAAGNLSPYEQYLLVRVRAPAEYATGDLAAAAIDFDAVLASDQLPAADRPTLMRAQAQILYADKQYAKAAVAIQRYLDAGGDDPQMRGLLPQAYYAANDFAPAIQGFQTEIDATTAAGRKPDEKTLRLLASAQSQGKDTAGYAATMERLAVLYPKPDYWKGLIGNAARVEKLSDRLYLDLYRLEQAALGDVTDSERLGFGELSLRAGYPSEAKRVLDDGLARKAFAGAELGEATRLRDQAARAAAQDKAQSSANESAAKAAKDGTALVNQGLLYTLDGDAAQGAALLDQGIARGGLKAPDEARLHLGMAQYLAGHPAEALKSFQAVPPTGGLGALAHVWALLAQSKLQATPAG